MSITISTCNQICNSPLNQSRAKMLYSFSKGERFKRLQGQLYLFLYVGVTSFMIRPVGRAQGLLALGLELSQISPKRNASNT